MKVLENAAMAESTEPDWYLQDWMRHCGKRQAALVNELGWTKGRAHGTWHGEFPYRRDTVNELARWLEIEPFELLLPPSRALALRRLKDTAAAIVADQTRTYDDRPGGGPKAAA